MWQDYDLLVHVLFSLSLFLNQSVFLMVFHGILALHRNSSRPKRSVDTETYYGSGVEC